jgi:hypothetical protein
MDANDPYQRGDSVEWLKHSNEELASLVKQRSRQLRRIRSFAFLLLVVLAWVAFKYSQKHPLRELWPF